MHWFFLNLAMFQIFPSVFKNTFWKHLGKSFFCLDFSKNIEKVWDIEEFCNIAKFRKNQDKNDRVRTFFYVQVFRWTGLIVRGQAKIWVGFGRTSSTLDKDIPDTKVWKKLIVQVVNQLSWLLASVVDMLCMRVERLVIRALTFVFLAFYIIDQVYFCEQWTIILNKLTYHNVNNFTPKSKK